MVVIIITEKYRTGEDPTKQAKKIIGNSRSRINKKRTPKQRKKSKRKM